MASEVYSWNLMIFIKAILKMVLGMAQDFVCFSLEPFIEESGSKINLMVMGSSFPEMEKYWSASLRMALSYRVAEMIFLAKAVVKLRLCTRMARFIQVNGLITKDMDMDKTMSSCAVQYKKDRAMMMEKNEENKAQLTEKQKRKQ